MGFLEPAADLDSSELSVAEDLCADKTKVWRSPSESGYDTGEMDASIVCTYMKRKSLI